MVRRYYTLLFKDFFESERSAGLVLICCTIVSLLLSNLPLTSSAYLEFWSMPLGSHTLTEWINDGLMAIFFLLIGLELEREIYAGELSSWKDGLLPSIAALGGMLVPALIYLAFTGSQGNYSNGFGIPMATDIAFAVGILSLLGNRVPTALKVFLTALAVIDDLGAILCIALFYSQSIDWLNLSIVGGIFMVLLVMNRLKVRNLIPYLLLGAVLWYFLLHSGVHATLAGILVAFAIPFGDGKRKSTSFILQHALHKPVAFLILPLFALANTGILLSDDFVNRITESYSLGVAIGLIIGKPLGIFIFSWLLIKTRWVKLPDGIQWKHILFTGALGGIGFTMSIFITLLAFDDVALQNHLKWVILIASTVAAVIGYIGLRVSLPKNIEE